VLGREGMRGLQQQCLVTLSNSLSLRVPWWRHASKAITHAASMKWGTTVQQPRRVLHLKIIVLLGGGG
jgi:hypothetical protein